MHLFQLKIGFGLFSCNPFPQIPPVTAYLGDAEVAGNLPEAKREGTTDCK